MERGSIFRDVMEKRYADPEYEWNRAYAPLVQDLGQSLEDAAKRAVEQAIARRNMQLGYLRSGTAGTSGSWDAAQSALQRYGTKLQTQAESTAEQFELGQHLEFLTREDAKEHERDMALLAFRQQMALLERQAELNEPSWWQGLGSIVGLGLGVMFSPWEGTVGAALF